MIIAIFNCKYPYLWECACADRRLVFVGPVPVQHLEIDRRAMQKVAFFSRKAEHDSVFSHVSFREKGGGGLLKADLYKKKKREEKKNKGPMQCKQVKNPQVMRWLHKQWGQKIKEMLLTFCRAECL